MGLIAEAVTGLRSLFAPQNLSAQWHPAPSWQDGIQQPMQLNYLAFANEGYGGNEIVYAAIEELSSSASEPKMVGLRGKTAVYDSKLLTLLENPNPFMDRFQLWATIIMHLYISGNAYALKVRSGAGRPVQLWLLRPDRVRIVPDSQKFIKRYDYWIGNSEYVQLDASDVIHWRKRNPVDDYYGMSPLRVIAPRIDTDSYLRSFVKAFLENAAVPAGILSTKNKLRDDQREDLRHRLKTQFGQGNWHETMILDGADATFTPITAQLGQRGIVAPELDEINEARLAMPFGVPLSLIGARLGMSSSSYGNRKSDRESFWDETLATLYKELEGPLNRDLTIDFPDLDYVSFDLSDVRALQEDKDKVHARVRADWMGGLISLESAQNKIGLEEAERTGTYLVPANMVPMSFEELSDPPPALTTRAQPETNPGGNDPTIAAPGTPAAPGVTAKPATGNRAGRPRIESDPVARAMWAKAQSLREGGNGLTWEQIAARIGISGRTLREYRARFEE
jgi:HK97 family phage portal protein